MRKAPLFIAFGGLALVVAGMLAGRSFLLPAPPAASTQEAARPAAREPEPARTTAKAERVRPVGSDLVAIPPIEPETLVRVEPREPLSPFGRPLPPPRRDNSRIHRPVADAAGRILGDGLLVDIAGVEIVEPDDACTDPEGIDWPCGMRARTAFRGLLRGRSLSCDVPPDYEETQITTGCTLGRLDLGRWIVANGWGRNGPGGPYAEQEEAAREAEKGIFGPAPVSTLPALTTLPDFMNNR
jgi:endonuclease YncB( thermonuclease family)